MHWCIIWNRCSLLTLTVIVGVSLLNPLKPPKGINLRWMWQWTPHLFRSPSELYDGGLLSCGSQPSSGMWWYCTWWISRSLSRFFVLSNKRICISICRFYFTNRSAYLLICLRLFLGLYFTVDMFKLHKLTLLVIFIIM